MQGSLVSGSTHARQTLGDGRIISFLRAAAVRSDLLAIDLAHGFLNDGMSLDFILATPEGGSTGFTMAAQMHTKDKVQIAFTMWTERKARSGGSWTVRFDEFDRVMDIQIFGALKPGLSSELVKA